MFVNPTKYYEGDRLNIVVDYLINPLKFFLPCLLLYDGCRTRERVVWALSIVLLAYFLLAVQGIKAVGLHFDMGGDELSGRAARVLNREVGYHRVDLSMILAGAAWATIVYSQFVKSTLIRWFVWGAAGVMMFGQALTGGRTGYVTWGLIRVTFCIVKWKRALPLIPVAAAIVIMVHSRCPRANVDGVWSDRGSIKAKADTSEITSGRTKIWPFVVDKIEEAPLFG